MNTYVYVSNSLLVFNDPTGECPWCIAYLVFEVGLAIYDAYDTASTVFDPCASTSERAIAGGLFLLGVVAPGGGYSKHDDIADAAKSVGRASDKAPNFVVSPGGTAFPVPKGATGPSPVVNPGGKTTGSAFTGGEGGANEQVDTIRIMNLTPARGKSPGYPNASSMRTKLAKV